MISSKARCKRVRLGVFSAISVIDFRFARERCKPLRKENPWATFIFPPLQLLAEGLIPFCGLREFVETGTYLGSSLPWAATHFERVRTIEIRADFMEAARGSIGPLANVEFLQGDSGVLMKQICESLCGPALFWLDAHAGAGFFGAEDRCPLLEELKAIAASGFDHCIFVDDARAFLAPPPPPFDYRKWPTLDDIMAILLSRPQIHVVAINDALIAVPRSARALVAEFCATMRPVI